MVRKEILIPTSAGDVFAVYTSAETPDSVKPLVIMCHGMMMSGSLNPIRDVAEGLNEGGYDTLRLDFRGNGRSSGAITDMTPLTEVNDLLSVIEYTVGHSEEFGSHGSIVLCWWHLHCPEEGYTGWNMRKTLEKCRQHWQGFSCWLRL